MRKFLLLFLLFFLINCSSTKGVYWCGDHPCINKKEKEAYFKETMIVEIRDLKKNDLEDDSNLRTILKQAKLDEKKRIKNEKDIAKLEKKREKEKIKREKELEKLTKISEKNEAKREKELEKIVKLEEKKRNKEKKRSKKKIKLSKKKASDKKIMIDTGISEVKIDLDEFEEFVEKIIERNSVKTYPDINKIPN